jgi:hypothetical protein
MLSSPYQRAAKPRRCTQGSRGTAPGRIEGRSPRGHPFQGHRTGLADLATNSAESRRSRTARLGDSEINAKTQRCKDAKKLILFFCASAPLRLCVKYLLFPAGFNPGCRSRPLAFGRDRGELRRARSVTLKGVAPVGYGAKPRLGCGRRPCHEHRRRQRPRESRLHMSRRAGAEPR